MEEQKHLNQIETALYAEYLMGVVAGNTETVAGLTDHLEDCMECRIKVMEICDIFPLLGSFLDDDHIMWVKDSGKKRKNWFNILIKKTRGLLLTVVNFPVSFILAHRSVRAEPHPG